MAQVFGPDAFTVGADTNIDAYPAGDADYAYVLGSGTNITVSGANDRAELVPGSDVLARLIDAAAPTSNQEVIVDASNAANNSYGAVVTRANSTAGGNGY